MISENQKKGVVDGDFLPRISEIGYACREDS